ncbi:MAG: hypothetical protein SFV17_21515 [Candidatus Obscuribacter sp.]|nr:hypothetical protein [Candidatus Obscuribacter sp.]
MTNSNNGKANEKSQAMVSVETGNLKERLNKLYDCRRGASKQLVQEGLFEYLWDLKEKALLEKRSTVEVPGNWLDELEELQDDRRAGS